MAYNYGTLIVLSIFSATSYYLFTRYQARAAAKAFCQKHGCVTMKAIPQNAMFLGYPFLRALMNARKANKFLDLWEGLFRAYGHTFSFTILGNYGALTNDMENIKAILATNFEDWSIGHRDKTFSPLLGHGGIFTSGEQGMCIVSSLVLNLGRRRSMAAFSRNGPTSPHTVSSR